jgi:hypothetical protein
MVNSQNMVQKESCSLLFVKRRLSQKFDGKAPFTGCFPHRNLLGYPRGRKICYTRGPYFHMSSTGNAEQFSAIMKIGL